MLSNHKGSGTRAFSMTTRRIFTDDITKPQKNLPAPGNYELPSDFGKYGDAQYYKKRKQNDD